ncbi:ribonuclease HII family protein (plasmid) [Bosea sp. RAC05]|nr:ribonuclease HII family protein [Bosea sp. RAC05]
MTRTGPNFDIETDAGRWIRHPIAGSDEAGRGPLAGPVVAAAVVLDPTRLPYGIDDSKKLSQKRLEEAYAEITAHALGYAVAMVSAADIDRINIRQATLQAMREAVLALPRFPGLVLFDGRDVPPGLPCKGRAIIQGDAKSLSIAAASIIAKVRRDLHMKELATRFPGYGFETHAGYGTAFHLKAIAELGPTTEHRMTFAPLKPRPVPAPAPAQIDLFERLGS